MAPARRLRGLDLLNFFTANVQTGFGPFVASFLTIHKWTDTEIGVALSVGTFTAMLSQVPAGAILDATRRTRTAAAAAILSIAACALLLGLSPTRPAVLLAELLHGFASCVMVPAVAAISLALVGPARMGERLGRNARWGAIGNGAAAALMGLCGQYVSSRAVFWLAAALAVPAALSLLLIGPLPAPPPASKRARPSGGWRLLLDRRLLAFAAAAVLFQVSNAAMMPLAASGVTERAGSRAPLIIAGAILVPQVVVAALSPWVGRAAERRGRRAVLLLGFSALPLRALALAALPAPVLLVPVQALDGISAAVFGVMLPLVAADLAADGGRFNLCIGVLGLAAGVGATLSTLFGGALADALGDVPAFMGLAGLGLLACAVVWAAMPDTRAAPACPPA